MLGCVKEVESVRRRRRREIERVEISWQGDGAEGYLFTCRAG